MKDLRCHKSTEFTDKLDVGLEKTDGKYELSFTSRFFTYTTEWIAVTFTEMGKTRRGRGFRGRKSRVIRI